MSFDKKEIEENTIIPSIIGHSYSLCSYRQPIIETFGDICYTHAEYELTNLDDCYGFTRDIFEEDGGYVGFIYNDDSWNYCNKMSKGTSTRKTYESADKFGDNCYKLMFVVNNETLLSFYLTKKFAKSYATKICKTTLEELFEDKT